MKTEYANRIESLELEPTRGTAMANSCYKIRVVIRSKGKGKAGGARVITYAQVVENNVFLACHRIANSMLSGAIADVRSEVHTAPLRLGILTARYCYK